MPPSTIKDQPVNNSDLADQIATDHNLSKADARTLVDGIFSTIIDTASKGEEVSISGFGKFKVKETAEREGRNPATGETITIAAGKKMGFAPAKSVKDKLNA
jgi:DNA-binding protein HU-beta